MFRFFRHSERSSRPGAGRRIFFKSLAISEAKRGLYRQQEQRLGHGHGRRTIRYVYLLNICGFYCGYPSIWTDFPSLCLPRRRPAPAPAGGSARHVTEEMKTKGGAGATLHLRTALPRKPWTNQMTIQPLLPPFRAFGGSPVFPAILQATDEPLWVSTAPFWRI